MRLYQGDAVFEHRDILLAEKNNKVPGGHASQDLHIILREDARVHVCMCSSLTGNYYKGGNNNNSELAR